MYPHLQVLMGIKSCGTTPPGAATYLDELGISKPGANKHHSVIQVGQALGNGCLGNGKRQVTHRWHGKVLALTPLSCYPTGYGKGI